MIQLILNKVLKLFGQSLVKNLNGDVGGKLHSNNLVGSKWRAEGVTSEVEQLY
jgi:hypothetical protein